jgi:hypothetical protein
MNATTEPLLKAAEAAPLAPGQQRKIVLAAVIGNLLEFFDFTVYSYFALTLRQRNVTGSTGPPGEATREFGYGSQQGLAAPAATGNMISRRVPGRRRPPARQPGLPERPISPIRY